LKAANEKAKYLLDKYTNLYNFAPSGYFTLNVNGKIKELNMAGAELLGMKGKSLKNSCFQAFLITDFIGVFNTFLIKIIETHEKQMCEVQLLNERESPLFAKIEGVVAQENEDNTKQILISVMDITEHKQIKEYKKSAQESLQLLNETLENDKLKLEFFSNISHELRTSLNVILSTLQLVNLLKKEQLEGESNLYLDKHIQVIKQNSFRLLRLINNVIDVTKIDSGYYDIKLQNYNIIILVKSIMTSVRPFIESKGIALELTSNVESRIIACDPDKIERIVLNIMSNAVKFTKPGGRISVDIFNDLNDITISLKDTGIGIPKDRLEEIFLRFRQIDKSLTREHEGSGIGLNLVKSIVNMLGGCIMVESELGEGSTFSIKLPAKMLANKEYEGDISGDDEDQGQIERIKIEFSDIY